MDERTTQQQQQQHQHQHQHQQHVSVAYDMDSVSISSSTENANIDYANYYDVSYESSLFSGASTEDYFGFCDNNSTITTNDSCFGEYYDNLSVDSRFYEETDSSMEDDRTGSYTTNSRSTPDSSIQSSSVGVKGSLNVIRRIPRTQSSGILRNAKEHEAKLSNDVALTHESLEKIRETELEDILQYARDIINPDPKAKQTYSTQPAKVVEGSFKHMLSIKELLSKTGAFKYRTVELLRDVDEEVGLSVRKGDGWEKEDGIYVSRISLGSIFDQFEIFRVGDEIVEVNKVNVKRMSPDDVIRLMHIPRKLSVTVKMLTPFSKKRLEQSSVEALKNNKFISSSTGKLNRRKFIASNAAAVSWKSSECLGKAAHLQIGSADKRNAQHGMRQLKGNTLQNNNNKTHNKERSKKHRGGDPSIPEQQQNQKTVKISPYRIIEGGGRPNTQRQSLSPIHEFSSAPSLFNSRKQSSYVHWFDEN